MKSPFTSLRESPTEPLDFSLVLGGPLYQLLRRAHLTDDTLALLRRRMIAIASLAWLPLALLTMIDGQFLDGVKVPFLMDADVHIKFLVAIPLLIQAELVVHQRMRKIAGTFLDRGLVSDATEPRFTRAIQSVFRLRNSLLAEVLLIAFVYGVGVTIIWRQYLSLEAATWYATPVGDGSALTLAGTWYSYVSLPIFQLLLVRWYFRIAIWAIFLWQLSRIPLNLVPTHPDRVCGLGFLADTPRAFGPLLVAHGAVLAGYLANQIFHSGAMLTQFKLEILLLLLFMGFLVIAPLLAFAHQLAQARRQGLRDYGLLAQRYVREFDTKWLRGPAPDEPLVGSADLQSLADLSNSFAVVQEVRVLPISRQTLLVLAAATLAPIGPLLLTLMPLEELLQRLLGAIF